MPAEMNFMIGGEAGQGVQSIGFLLSKAFARGGHHIFADQDYESRIRGGYSFFRVRVKDKPVYAVVEPVDMLLALNKETIDLHLKELTPRGIIIYDGEKIKLTNSDSKLFSVPLEKLAEEAGGKIMSNTVALGAALGLIKYDFELLAKLLREHFGHKGEIAEANVKAAKAGFDYAGKEFTGDFPHHLSPIGDGKRLLLNGTDAVSLGALAAGCKFVSAYPMTPITPIMEYIASKSKDFNVVVVHAEDEIAAMNMAVGAGYAGVSFAARAFAGDIEHLTQMLKLGIKHRGFALINVLQPCPSFNFKNTYAWYKERVYKLGDDYDPTNKIGAFQKAQEWDDKIPIGVLYRKERPTFEDQLPALKAGPLVRQKLDPAQVASILSEFM